MHYRQNMGYLMERIPGDTLIADVPGRVEAFIDQRIRVDGVTSHTVHKQLAVLVQVMKLAKHRGWWSGDPSALKPRHWKPNYQPGERWLPEDELIALCRALPPHRRAQVAFVVATGARYTESCHASPADVDTERFVIDLHGTKTRLSERDVPILPYTWPLIAVALEHLPFPKWGQGNRSRDMRAACKRAGIASCNFHDLRRTAAWWAAKRTGQYQLVPRFLGHASPTMALKVYAKLDGEALGEAMGRNL